MADVAVTLPKDVWSVIIRYSHIYDTIFIRATSSWLYNYCKQFQPLPKYFVLDQDHCMEYLIENGSISCLDYVKDILRFEWTDNFTSLAARFGQLDLLKNLIQRGCSWNEKTILLDCTEGLCDLETVKYLRTQGASWDQVKSEISDGTAPNQNNSPYRRTIMENMAYHGHISCMIFAMENGCNDRVIQYAPSIECLEFAIKHNFDWKRLTSVLPPDPSRRENICEVAARLGNLKILKFAHTNGVPLNNSTMFAANHSHLDCLKYTMENKTPSSYDYKYLYFKTIECFEYFVNNYPPKSHFDVWMNQLEAGNTEILRLMVKKGFEMPDLKLLVIVACRSKESFKFVMEEMKVPIENFAPLFLCAKKGNIEGVKLAIENMQISVLAAPQPNSKMQTLIRVAVQSKSIDLVTLLWNKFITPNKEMFNFDKCQEIAAAEATPEILDFLTQQGLQWTSRHLALASVDNLPNMAYFLRIGCQYTEALCKKHVCAKYARDHGCTNIITAVNLS